MSRDATSPVVGSGDHKEHKGPTIFGQLREHGFQLCLSRCDQINQIMGHVIKWKVVKPTSNTPELTIRSEVDEQQHSLVVQLAGMGAIKVSEKEIRDSSPKRYELRLDDCDSTRLSQFFLQERQQQTLKSIEMAFDGVIRASETRRDAKDLETRRLLVGEIKESEARITAEMKTQKSTMLDQVEIWFRDLGHRLTIDQAELKSQHEITLRQLTQLREQHRSTSVQQQRVYTQLMHKLETLYRDFKFHDQKQEDALSQLQTIARSQGELKRQLDTLQHSVVRNRERLMGEFKSLDAKIANRTSTLYTQIRELLGHFSELVRVNEQGQHEHQRITSVLEQQAKDFSSTQNQLREQTQSLQLIAKAQNQQKELEGKHFDQEKKQAQEILSKLNDVLAQTGKSSSSVSASQWQELQSTLATLTVRQETFSMQQQTMLQHQQAMEPTLDKTQQHLERIYQSITQGLITRLSRVIEKQQTQTSQLAVISRTLTESQSRLLHEINQLPPETKDRSGLREMIDKLDQLLKNERQVTEQNQKGFAELQPNIERLLVEQQQMKYQQQFVQRKLEELSQSDLRMEGRLEHIDTQVAQLLTESHRQVQELDAVEDLLHQVKSDLKQNSTKTEVVDERFRVIEVQKFYAQFKQELEEFYAFTRQVAEGKVDPKQTKVKAGTQLARGIGELIPIPYVSLCINLLSSVVEKADQCREVKEAKSVAHVVGKGNIIDQVAYSLAYKYQRQIAYLTDDGVKALAKCARKRIMGYVVTLDTKEVTSHLSEQEKVKRLLNGAIEGNPSNLINTDVFTKDTRKFTAEGLLKRPGLELEDGSRYVRTTTASWRKDSMASRPDKYGFRYGTDEERERFHYNQKISPELTETSLKETSPLSATTQMWVSSSRDVDRSSCVGIGVVAVSTLPQL